MIKIGRPYVTEQGKFARLNADITVDDKNVTLWVEVPKEYSTYLCWERADAFLLGLLHYAMEFGYDIKCDAPVTKRLYEQLTELFLPSYLKLNKIAEVRIVADTADEVEHPGVAAIATGVSCGVDSMHVFAKHPELTHGVVFDLHDGNWRTGGERQALAWKNLVEQARTFTNHVGVKLLTISTNYDKGVLPGLKYEWQTGFASLFMIFSVQKLIGQYYIASGYSIEDFKLKVRPHEDVAYYEPFLFPHVCLRSINVRLDGIADTRLDKVKKIADYEPAQKFLNVCMKVTDDRRNCCECWKCKRTILELMASGNLEKFSSVFPQNLVCAHHYDYALALERGRRMKDVYSTEMYPLLSGGRFGVYRAGLELTMAERLSLLWQVAVRDRLHNLKRKFVKNG